MRAVTTFFTIAVVFSMGCSGGSSKKSPTGAPQKQSAASAHHRIYITYQNCDFTTARFEGWNLTEAYETVIPEQMDESVSWKYLKLAIKDANQVVHRTVVINPMLKIIAEQMQPVYQCKGTFFVDVPNTVKASDIASVVIENGEPERHVTIATRLVGEPSVGLKETQAMTAAEALKNTPHRILKFYGDSAPEEAWDLVILGDGFTAEELRMESDESLRASKFGKTVQGLVEALFQYELFSNLKDKINVWVVATPSRDSGTDIPSQSIEKDTFYDSSMDFSCVSRLPGIRRGLLAYEMAAKTPYDQAMVLVNSNVGTGSGGAFIVLTMGEGYKQTFVHELGHSVGKLADSYYYYTDNKVRNSCKDTQYGEYISAFSDQPEDQEAPSDVWAPNETLYADHRAKWKSLLPEETEPVYIAYPLSLPTTDKQKGKIVFSAQFKETAGSVIFMPAPYGASSFNNFFTEQIVKITIDGVSIQKDKMRIFEKNALSTAQILKKSPADAGIFRFLEADIPVVAGKEVRVELEFTAEARNATIFSSAAFDANSFKFVSRVFEPSGEGLFQGSGMSLTDVYRPGFASMMTRSGNEFSRAEEAAMQKALLPYTQKTLKKFSRPTLCL